MLFLAVGSSFGDNAGNQGRRAHIHLYPLISYNERVSLVPILHMDKICGKYIKVKYGICKLTETWLGGQLKMKHEENLRVLPMYSDVKIVQLE